MGDKDTDKLFGNSEILICDPNGELKPLGKVVECSTSLNPEDAAELDSLSVREKMLTEPLSIGPISFECGMPICDVAPILGIDLASEPSKQVCSLVIQSEPKINKPKNLKYPNKKRARRIWKKWAKRFGTTQGKSLYLPNVEIDCGIVSERDGFLRYDVKAEPIKPIIE